MWNWYIHLTLHCSYRATKDRQCQPGPAKSFARELILGLLALVTLLNNAAPAGVSGYARYRISAKQETSTKRYTRCNLASIILLPVEEG
jgi:hypothetical protein